MINRFKSFLKDMRQDLKIIKSGQNQLWATQKLQSFFSEGHFIPQTSWSLSPQAIVHCLNIISINKPKSIIEFGSGATTLYIAKLLQLRKHKISFISVESDPQWKMEIERQLQLYNLQDYVTLILAPIIECATDLRYKDQETWYDVQILNPVIKPLEHFDLIIVDGPFGGSTPFARYSAFPFLEKQSSIDSIWILDDTEREQEKEIIREWQRQSGLHKIDYKRYTVMKNNKQFDLAPYRIH
ncbi:MAG: hypothetical protein CL868_01460 [Cytophagaceae bacterium]|nr:hypothetical protein [Cytophagaceae bacterium]|tara:strand:- start:422 stop:1144 length:723 start_codon:yes stop_codon:yes gene_type:complete